VNPGPIPFAMPDPEIVEVFAQEVIRERTRAR
jgi:hypothetical protein